MQHDELSQLIELAAKKLGSKTEVARELGVSPQRLHDWKTGFRPCPIENVAILADMAGLPPEIWLARAALWTHEGTPKGERLQRALGKYARVIGAALALCLALVAGMQATDRGPVFLSR